MLMTFYSRYCNLHDFYLSICLVSIKGKTIFRGHHVVDEIVQVDDLYEDDGLDKCRHCYNCMTPKS